MAIVKLKWTNLLKLTELEFEPDIPALLTISDEVLQVISWLTGTTGFDRRLLRCTVDGALLVAKPWSNMNVVENDELYPTTGIEDSTAALVANKGVLVATSTQIVMINFYRQVGADYDAVYVPPNSYYWFPFPCYQVIAMTVPFATGTASYVGITTFK